MGLCKPCREEVRSFLGNKVRRAFQRQAICGEDIRSCNCRQDKPEKSVLKQRWRRLYKHLRRKSHSCTCNLELQEGMSAWDGRKQKDQVRLTHCGETGAYFASKKSWCTGEIQCAFVWKTCSRFGFWEKVKRKRGGVFEGFIS